MTALARWAAPAFSPAFGVLMVGLAAVGSHGLAVAAGAAALVAVGVGTILRSAATLAVLLAVATVMLSGAPPVYVSLSGLSAAAYLACGHAVGGSARMIIGSVPTAVVAVGFTVAAFVATSVPAQLPWLPLTAPLGALAIYVLATRPFWGAG